MICRRLAWKCKRPCHSSGS